MGTDNSRAWRIGPKEVATGEHAVCGSQSPIVTDVMLDVLRQGGSAIDAGIAGCLVQGVVQQYLTNHSGTVSLLYYEASTGTTHELNGWGTMVSGFAPFRPLPAHKAGAATPPCAAIPGYMPGLKAIYERFGTRPWAELCEPAIHWAEEGHVVTPFESFWLLSEHVDMYTHTASGREHFAANGFVPQVGDRFPKQALARTMRHLADEGPDYFTVGGWAKDFVQRANDLGWPIELKHMSQLPPRWGSGLRYRFRGNEVVQLAPPECAGVSSAMVLGIMDELGVEELGHFTESAEALYYLAHTLRRVEKDMGYINDPLLFEDPTATLVSADYHRHIADIIRSSRPKIDLSEHVETTAGRAALAAAGATSYRQVSLGTSALSIVDTQGNWAQITHTSQGGGIPGEVVGGVTMRGFNTEPRLDSPLQSWFTGGGRSRGICGNTIVFSDGKPVWSLGMPSRPHMFIPQILVNRLIYGMDPYAAEDAPRLYRGLTDDYRLLAESRIPANVVDGLVQQGVLLDPLTAYTFNVGSTQMSWRDARGRLHAVGTPRDEGTAAAF